METVPKPLKPEGVELDPNDLVAKRYGTYDTIQVWGAERTFEYSLFVQGKATSILSSLHPDIVPPHYADEIVTKASLKYVDPNRIRKLETATGHDAIAITTALEEILSLDAKPYPGQIRTSADTTQSARALQIKTSLEIIADSAENLRDILIEKAVKWIDKPHMDSTHLYDALPTVVGRPLVHYAEMLQSGLKILKFFYENSIKGKWADATGNHHGAVTLSIDGIALEEAYCQELGIGHMIAPAQIPGLEFEADIVFVIARLGETLNNIANYVAWGRSDDVNIFINMSPQKKKGSSAMPHKDAKGGNPIIEEQTMSFRGYAMGLMTTALANCEMPYARNLAASANSRINFEGGFKFLDHVIRNLAYQVYWVGLRESRALERVIRSYGVVTAPQVLTYLTDPRKVKNPLPRSEVHSLIGELATEAWDKGVPFVDMLLGNMQITSRLNEATLRRITDPLHYIGESKENITLALYNSLSPPKHNKPNHSNSYSSICDVE